MRRSYVKKMNLTFLPHEEKGNEGGVMERCKDKASTKDFIIQNESLTAWNLTEYHCFIKYEQNSKKRSEIRTCETDRKKEQLETKWGINKAILATNC